MDLAFTLKELVGILEDVAVDGEFDGCINGIASLSEAVSGDVSFLGNRKYRSEVKDCRASAIFLPADFAGTPSRGQVYLRTKNPSLALARVTQTIEHKLWPKPSPGVHPKAFVDETAVIEKSVHVGPLSSVGAQTVIEAGVSLGAGVHVGRNVRVGQNSRLMPGVVVHDYCELGQEVILQAGCVIGSDGYGYETTSEGHVRVPQIGKVVIEDFVEVGANSTIDRARFKETRIGEGTKIDNLVQIAHNVKIGRNCLIVAQAGVSGSTVLENNVVLGGQSGVAGHLHIGEGVSVAGQSGVSKSLNAGDMVRGTPAFPYLAFQRIAALQKRLPEFFKRLKTLEQICDPKDKS